MKSLKQKNKRQFLLFKTVFILFFVLCTFSAGAKPFVIRSVDGSWLPVIASSWSTKNGGVLVKISDGIKVSELRNEMLSKIPDLIVEIIGRDLFFPTTTIDSLFEVLKNIDLETSLPEKSDSAMENRDMFVKKGLDASLKDEYIEALVENRIFDEKNSKVVVFIKIQQRAKTGAFAKLNGRYRIEHVFEMKNGIVDPENSENKLFVPLIMLKKGNKITFVPEKFEYRILTIKPDFKVK